MSFYGFVKPTYSLATDAVSSFGSASGSGNSLQWNRDNQVAATEAAPPAGVTRAHSARSQLSVGQSRGGFFAKRDRVDARIEMDFVDFDRSQAATALRPRLRIAGANIALTDHLLLFGGQDWDIIAGPKPFTYNYVGLYFHAGIKGFMRPLFRLTWQVDAHKEILSVALGAAGINDSSANTSAVERGVTPTAGFRFNAVRADNLTVGIAAVGTARRLESNAIAGDVRMKQAWLAKSFIDFHPGSRLKIRADVFGGVNAQSTGSALSLATASYNGNQEEIGGFLSADVKIFEHFDLFGGSGIDHMLSSSESRSGELRDNWVSRMGADWNFYEQVHFFTETSYFRSHYQWTGVEHVSGKALQVETGLTVEI